ncbi:hypothetical protein [Pseudomonas sp. AP3_22 TE3818]|nr:hypothetical protein [Pseudomonas reinekei]
MDRFLESMGSHTDQCRFVSCRSRLAGDGGGSVKTDVACQIAIAGKPAPTGD